MEIEAAPEKPQEKKAIPEVAPPKKSLTARLAELKKGFEKPLIERHKFSELAADPKLDLPPFKQTFLSASVGVSLDERLGKMLHGDYWQKDPKWMKQEIAGLLELDKKRLEREHKELLAELEGRISGVEEMKDVPGAAAAAERKAPVPPLKVVPKIHYWKKGEHLTELKELCKKTKQAENDRKRIELETAKHDRVLAEMKVQMMCTELKAKLLDLKLSGAAAAMNRPAS